MEQKLPLSVDWLALSLKLSSPVREAPSGHKWVKYKMTNVWGQRWCLFNDYGDKIFTLLFAPRQSIISSDSALLEIANEWLYHGLGVHGVLSLLSKVVGFTISGISRYDLAVDFVPTLHQHDVIVGLDTKQLRVSGKQNGSGFWSQNKDIVLSDMWRDYCPHDMNWGHKTSNVKWKLYYKSKELRDGAGKVAWDKPYIVDMWREVGLDIGNVWRLEVSIKNCNSMDWKGDRLDFHWAMKEPIQIFKNLYTERFQIRRNEGHKDKSNDTIVDFLPVGRMRGAFRTHREHTLAQHDGAITLLRHLVADVQTEQVLLNNPIFVSTLSTIRKILDINQMHEYFLLMTGYTFDAWCEWLVKKSIYFDADTQPVVWDTGEKMEREMIESGLINDPLATESSMSPSRSDVVQLQMFGDKLP